MFTRNPRTAKIGVEILPLEVGYLPEYFKKKGEVELNYTPIVRCNSLLKLKKVIANDKRLKSLDCTDEALLVFLNSRKYDIDRTVQQLNKYIKFRKSNPHMFTNINYEVLSPLLSSNLFIILPWRCQDGCGAAIINPDNFDPQTHNTTDILKMFVTILTQTLRDPMNQVNGFKAIYDLQISFKNLRFFTPQTLSLIYSVAEKTLAARVKEHHVVNMGVTGKIMFQIMKMFMSEKMQKRVFIHQSIDELLDFFPKAVLPVQYGGDLKEYDLSEWLRKVTSEEELAALNILSN